jgi:hypothetical protein
MRRIDLLAISILLLFSGTLKTQTSEPLNFLILKPGDPGATNELAADYLNTVADYFVRNTPFLRDKNLRGWIANHPDSAVAIMKKHPPIMAFAPAGFYFKHLVNSEHPATPIAQSPRFGKSVEHYYIVTSKSGTSALSALKGKTVRTYFGIDRDYLRKVVLPADFQPGTFLKLDESQNLADDVFLLIENGQTKEAVTAILIDEELKHFFEIDDLVWPQLKIIWTSSELPRELFVAIGEGWNEARKKELFDALQKMNGDQKGKELLQLLQSTGFTAVDSALLNRTLQKYFSNAKVKP